MQMCHRRCTSDVAYDGPHLPFLSQFFFHFFGFSENVGVGCIKQRNHIVRLCGVPPWKTADPQRSAHWPAIFVCDQRAARSEMFPLIPTEFEVT